MAKKGISLPIEMIIIIAIAVLVLIVLAAFFLVGWGGSGIPDEAAYNKGCATLRFSLSCGELPSNVKPFGYVDKTPQGDVQKSMLDACIRTNRGTTDEQCSKACGC